MPKDVSTLELTEETPARNWKQYVKPVAFVAATVAVHVGVRLVINALVKNDPSEETTD